MKLNLTISSIGLAIGAFILISGATNLKAQPGPAYNTIKGQSLDFNAFYNALSPYGLWEDNPAYGKVWVCNLPGFVPYYTGGNWVFTDAGWAWASTYSWGWGPFHYGRWAFVGHWFWVPGYEWAPAWVTWRSGGGYYGWAPLGPGAMAGLDAGPRSYMPVGCWTFCKQQNINSQNFTNYCLERRENINIITNTTIINTIAVYRNTRCFAGPAKTEVEGYTGKGINVVHVCDAANPGAALTQANDLLMYRPTAGATNSRMPNSGTQQTDGRGQTPVAPAKRSQNIVQPPGRHAVYNTDRPLPMKRNGNTDSTGNY